VWGLRRRADAPRMGPPWAMDNVLDLLLANLERLWAGELELVNGIV